MTVLYLEYLRFLQQLDVSANYKDRKHQKQGNFDVNKWDDINEDEIKEDLELHNVFGELVEVVRRPLLVCAD